jgi:hypothetical protein
VAIAVAGCLAGFRRHVLPIEFRGQVQRNFCFFFKKPGMVFALWEAETMDSVRYDLPALFW